MTKPLFSVEETQLIEFDDELFDKVSKENSEIVKDPFFKKNLERVNAWVYDNPDVPTTDLVQHLIAYWRRRLVPAIWLPWFIEHVFWVRKEESKTKFVKPT